MAARGRADRSHLQRLSAVIFATVGTQLAFSRLMMALDAIAARHNLDVLAQTCEPGLQVRAIKAQAHLTPKEFDEAFKAARVVVAHAGIGTILSAKRHGKPLILMPRRASLGEHRNEHQLATVQQMRGRPGIHIAETDADLEALLLKPDLEAATNAASPSRTALVNFLRDYIDR
jgi:UDP-N-acetylglucosamine transferase subunit ALG13